MVIKLSQEIINPETKFHDIVNDMIILSEQPLILFVWLYFLLNKANIQAFFNDWNRMEEQHFSNNKGIDSAKIKRTCLIVHILYYTYGFVYLSLTIYVTINNDINIKDDYDLIASYYPDLFLNTSYKIWFAIQAPMWVALYIVMFPLIDIVPTFVYYHAANMVEAITWEIREIAKNEAPSSVSNSGMVHSLRSRLETLIAMVDRTNKLFGSMVILCQGILFFIICCGVYNFLLTVKGSSYDDIAFNVPAVFLTTLALFPPRLVFTISFMSKLNSSSDQLLSAVSYFSYQREFCADSKEERRVVRSFIGRLSQTKLAANPSGFYKIKPSVFLNLLSLIVTYTVILMQTSDAPTKSNTLQKNFTCFPN